MNLSHYCDSPLLANTVFRTSFIVIVTTSFVSSIDVALVERKQAVKCVHTAGARHGEVPPRGESKSIATQA